jgi:glutamate synthase domain-containing protein 1
MESRSIRLRQESNRCTQEYFSRYRIPSGCAIFGIMDQSGKRFNGIKIIDGIALMHERSNGLGGGFAGYGIYPQYKDDWAFHIIYDNPESRCLTEKKLSSNFRILYSEEIPIRKVKGIKNPPITYRYFLKPADFVYSIGSGRSPIKTNSNQEILNDNERFKIMEEDFILDFVMELNSGDNGSYIISSGKNMGIFKGVGFPEDIGNFFRLDSYRGHLWISHGRFPTNTIGWWGGSHPFGLLGWSVVHNGEISSYGTNRRFVSGFGYNCVLSTDTEVITYLFDLIVRKQRIDLDILHLVLSPPLWDRIERMSEDEMKLAKTLRILYGGALINGPFSIITATSDCMYALNDRVKLRPLAAAKKGDFLFISSEEASIRFICPHPDVVWHPGGGEPVIGRLNKKSAIDHKRKIAEDVLNRA